MLVRESRHRMPFPTWFARNLTTAQPDQLEQEWQIELQFYRTFREKIVLFRGVVVERVLVLLPCSTRTSSTSATRATPPLRDIITIMTILMIICLLVPRFHAEFFMMQI